MKSALLLLVGAIAASCAVSGTGLEGTVEGTDAESAGRSSGGPAGFAGVPEDAGSSPATPGGPAPAGSSPVSPITPPPAMADARAAAPAADLRVLRVHDVKAGHLTARIIHAHELEAAAGTAGRVLPPDPDPLLKVELGAEDLEAGDLTVDVLYAHDIKSGSVHADETHAKVKIGKGHQNED
jgi:hypothetical protein